MELIKFIRSIFCYYQEEDFDWLANERIKAGWRLRFGWAMLLMIVITLSAIGFATWKY